MVINIRAIGMDLTPAIRQYVEEKLSGLEKYAAETIKIMQMDVDIGRDTAHHHKGEVFTCSVNVDIPGDLLKVERNADDLYKAIDKVRDHLRETLAQRKDKMIEERRGSK